MKSGNQKSSEDHFAIGARNRRDLPSDGAGSIFYQSKNRQEISASTNGVGFALICTIILKLKYPKFHKFDDKIKRHRFALIMTGCTHGVMNEAFNK